MYKVTRFLFLFVIMMACKNEPVNTKISGPVFGTTYAVIYDDETNYESQFDSLFNVINASMSTYIRNSDISQINRNESTVIDPHFEYVLKSSKTIYENTDGAFDPTIGAVVNAWDFGPEGKIESLDSLKIDSLMKYVGLSKVTFKKGNIQKPKGTFIDFNAIAKGYAVDVIAEFLDKNDVFEPLYDEVSKFSNEQYQMMRPLVLEQDIPTIQSHIRQGKFTYEDLVLFYLHRIYLLTCIPLFRYVGI